MRLISILIALIVVVALYFFIVERDSLEEFANVPEATQTETKTGTAAETTVPADEAEVDPVAVSVRQLEASEIDSMVVLRGETEAARQVAATAETSGRVISEPLRKGAYVQEGQILCEIDPGTRDAKLAQARAAESEAEVALENATRLNEGGYAAQTRVLSAEAAVEAARAAVADIERDIANLEVKAPFSGLLESDAAELGTFLQAGSVCATVIQLDPIKLVGYAPEADVDRIEVGALTAARFVSGQEVTGRVTFLSRSADQATRTFRVEIAIPNSDFAIRDGQTVEMVISSAGKTAHLVPQSALTLDDEGQIGLRLVGEGNIVDFVPVEVLRDTRDGVWVAGLPEVADVIVVGQEYVREGVLVEPSYEEMTQ